MGITLTHHPEAVGLYGVPSCGVKGLTNHNYHLPHVGT